MGNYSILLVSFLCHVLIIVNCINSGFLALNKLVAALWNHACCQTSFSFLTTFGLLKTDLYSHSYSIISLALLIVLVLFGHLRYGTYWLEDVNLSTKTANLLQTNQ